MTSLRRSSTPLRLDHQQTIARQHSSPTIAAGTAMARMLMAPRPALSCAPGDRCGGGNGESEEDGGGGGGGGATFAMVGGVTTASTAIETPVTLASMAVAPLGLLVALAIVDCTEVAITAYVWMLTRTMTLPDVTVTVTADGSTPALAAIAPCISVRALVPNEETSPASSRANPMTLIAGGDGGGDGGGGEGGGCGSEGGGDDGGGGGGEGGGEGSGGEQPLAGAGGEGDGDGEGEGGGGEIGRASCRERV